MVGLFQMRSSDVHGHLQVLNSKAEVMVSMMFRYSQVKQEMIFQ